MPNWVHNTVKVKANQWEEFVKDTITIDENGEERFDFGKVIPISEDLNITSGCGSYKKVTELYHAALWSDDLKFQADVVDKFCEQFYNDTITQKEFVKLASDNLKKGTNKKILEALREKYGDSKSFDMATQQVKKNGILYETLFAGYFNTRRHGYPDWYSANCDMWGTKWNACETYISEQECIVSFDTAWSCPEPILMKLSEKYDIIVAFADEDIGSNYGLYKLTKDGITTIIDCDGEKSSDRRTAEAIACRFESIDGYLEYCEEENEPVNDLEKEFEKAEKIIEENF